MISQGNNPKQMHTLVSSLRAVTSNRQNPICPANTSIQYTPTTIGLGDIEVMYFLDTFPDTSSAVACHVRVPGPHTKRRMDDECCDQRRGKINEQRERCEDLKPNELEVETYGRVAQVERGRR